MIKKEILRKLPLEYQKMKITQKKENAQEKKLISVNLYQSSEVRRSHFHRPISKFIKYFDE